MEQPRQAEQLNGSGAGARNRRRRYLGRCLAKPDPLELAAPRQTPQLVVPAKIDRRGRQTAPAVYLTTAQSEEVLAATRKRAEGWRTGSTSLVALIVASLVLRSASGWMNSLSNEQLYAISALVAIALLFALVSMWITLRAANGPHRIDTRVRDYYTPHDAKRIFNRARSAAKDLRLGQVLLWIGVMVFCVAAFASWLLDPHAEPWWTLR